MHSKQPYFSHSSGDRELLRDAFFAVFIALHLINVEKFMNLEHWNRFLSFFVVLRFLSCECYCTETEIQPGVYVIAHRSGLGRTTYITLKSPRKKK